MHLLDLPAELRNHIYTYVFTPPSPSSSSSTTIILTSNPPLPHPASTILRPLLTCRRIHDEAAALAYSAVTFTTHAARPYSAHAHHCFPPPAPPPPPLTPLLRASIRRIVLVAAVGQLRPLAESWGGWAFGCPDFRLARLTLVPRRPEVLFGGYAEEEVAHLSQCHTLAFILAELVTQLRRGSVGQVVVRNEDGCFEEDTMRLVYRSMVYKLWRGAYRPLCEQGFREGEKGREFCVWMGNGARQKGNSLYSEFTNLSSGMGSTSAAGWGYVAMQ